MKKIHLPVPSRQFFSACGKYSQRNSNYLPNITCFNCQRSKVYEACFKKLSRKRLPRFYLTQHLHQTLTFIGRPIYFNPHIARLLLLGLYTHEGKLICEHIWLDGVVDPPHCRYLVFEATCIWYQRKDQSLDFGLRMKRVIRIIHPMKRAGEVTERKNCL